MYGTVAKLKIKPGTWDAFRKLTDDESTLGIKGYVAQTVYRMDSNPNEAYLTVIFDSKESYVANAESAEQHARYLEMLKFLDGEPEWHDGEVVYAHHS